jgi:2-oxoglutarate ferredoxin oxidoreductase subunit gamma
MERIEIRLAGSGGQGLITGARILFEAFSLEGRRAAQSQSYEPTSRGGFCHSDLILSEDATDYPLVTGLDVLIALDQVGADRSAALVKPGATVIYDERLVDTLPAGDLKLHALPLNAQAVAAGSARGANIVALGAFAALSGSCSLNALEEAIRRETPVRFVAMNLEAARAGFRLGQARAA